MFLKPNLAGANTPTNNNRYVHVLFPLQLCKVRAHIFYTYIPRGKKNVFCTSRYEKYVHVLYIAALDKSCTYLYPNPNT